MSFDNKWDTEIYKNHAQVNRYPFDSVVSTVFRYFGSTKTRSDIKILELGCGTANNISFLAQEGFSAIGLDGSEHAIQLGRNLLKKKGLNAELICQDFTKLSNFEDESFDMVIDRGSITHNRRKDIETTISDVHRVLKDRGIFLSQIFSSKHSAVKYGKRLEDGTLHEFSGGFFAGHPMIFYFATDQDIIDLYESRFTMLSKLHNVSQEMLNEDDYRAMWNLVCQKN